MTKTNQVSKNFAPVLIPTLHRFEHFKRCVESLSRCTYADKTDLYIALDYPLNESHAEGHKKISEYVDKITGFKSVTIFRRDVNYGIKKNIRTARKYIFERHDSIINSEDDNEFSPNFLDYQNKCLYIFKDDKKVRVICGYSVPLKISDNYKYDYYYAKHNIAWGFGIWKNKEISVQDADIDDEINKVEKYLFNPFKAYNLIFMPYFMLTDLIHTVKTKTFNGDQYISFKNLIEGKYCVYPKLSLVRNHGHDGSGIHCGTITQNPFVKQIIDTRTEFKFKLHNDYENRHIKRAIKKYIIQFQYYSFRSKISLLKSYLLFIISGGE